MSTDRDCVFCQIVAGAAEASQVYQDDKVTAFMDILPVNVGHLLVIPNNHTPDLASLDEATGSRMFTVAMRLAGILRVSGLRCEGVNLYLADGRAAGQEVFHIHFHVVPRFLGDGFGIRRSKQLEVAGRNDLEAVADKIRAALDG